jgi:hypothetical protein
VVEAGDDQHLPGGQAERPGVGAGERLVAPSSGVFLVMVVMVVISVRAAGGIGRY